VKVSVSVGVGVGVGDEKWGGGRFYFGLHRNKFVLPRNKFVLPTSSARNWMYVGNNHQTRSQSTETQAIIRGERSVFNLIGSVGGDLAWV
jgi:hypothetical protein